MKKFLIFLALLVAWPDFAFTNQAPPTEQTEAEYYCGPTLSTSENHINKLIKREQDRIDHGGRTPAR